jgi:holo-[acyl-carrier protein] synthase
MTIYGVGVDIVEIPRIQRALRRWGEPFIRRVFTVGEQDHARHPRVRMARLATRFAAKEAVMKALGLGWRTMAWREIEISNDPLGKPTVTLHGTARHAAEQYGIRYVHISLSHTHDLACATAIAWTSPSSVSPQA